MGLNKFGVKFIDMEILEVYDVKKVNFWGVLFDIWVFYDILVINGNYWLVINNGFIVIVLNGKILKKIESKDLGVEEEVNLFLILVVDDDIWIGIFIGLFLFFDGVVVLVIEVYNFEVIYLNVEMYNIIGILLEIIIKVIEDRMGVVWVVIFYWGVFKYYFDFVSVYF